MNWELWEIYSNLGFTILGAALSLIFFILYDYLGQVRIPSGLFRDWYSTWQPTSQEGWDWVTDIVEIRRGLWGIRLSNRDNSKNLEFKGKARLINQTYLIGQWSSRKPGSNAEGVFALTFSTDGDALLGFFLTRDMDRPKFASGFALGRTERDRDVAREKIGKMRIRFPRDSFSQLQ